MLIKRKHKCTNSLIVDLIKMLRVLKVPNVPESWQVLKRIIRSIDQFPKHEKIIKSTLYFCSHCERESTKPNKCTNENCEAFSNVCLSPHRFLLMDVQIQLEQVLKCIDKNDLHLEQQMVSDGEVYCQVKRSLKSEQHKSFISLTCNIDGVAVYTNSECHHGQLCKKCFVVL